MSSMEIIFTSSHRGFADYIQSTVGHLKTKLMTICDNHNLCPLTIGNTSNSPAFARGASTSSQRMAHCAFITSRKDSRILKWNAGVSIFLLKGIVQKLTFSTNSRIDNILLQPVLTLCATWPLCWLEDLCQFKIEHFLIQNYMRTPVSI